MKFKLGEELVQSIKKCQNVQTDLTVDIVADEINAVFAYMALRTLFIGEPFIVISDCGCFIEEICDHLIFVFDLKKNKSGVLFNVYYEFIQYLKSIKTHWYICSWGRISCNKAETIILEP
jgi:hypothetical protein